MPRDENSLPIAFRLYGTVEGIDRSFPINAPITRLGAHPSSDILLPFSGVSRHHAVLTADSTGIVVEDRNSKNGILVNGLRTDRARLAPGDELTVGPATLSFQTTDPEDARLSLIFDSEAQPEPDGGAVSDLRETDLLDLTPTVSPTSQLRWIEDFVRRRAAPGATLAEALAGLHEDLECQSIGAVTWQRGTVQRGTVQRGTVQRGTVPGILGAAGDVEGLGHALLSHRAVLRQARERTLRDGWQLELTSTTELVASLLATADDAILMLVVCGDFCGRSSCGPWTRLLCRLIAASEGLTSATTSRETSSREGSRLAFPDGMVVGRSAAARALYRELLAVSGGDYPVLIVGETGSGKELVAKTLHLSSPRADGPFIAINCAAIPGELLEAEMFGVVRGAATGVAPRAGCFQRAEGGILFLDEIAEMRPELQAKLLRALEYREVQPVGGAPRKVDVRVLSATNAALDQRIAAGQFRADLYYRLAVSLVQVPPLRSRRDDLPPLIQHFVQAYAEELGVQLRGLTHRALMILMFYKWPGNVRQLQHEIRRMVQRALPGQVIDSALLSPQLKVPSQSAPSEFPPPDPAFQPPRPGALSTEAQLATSEPRMDLDLRSRLAEVECEVIRLALERTGGHRSQAAKLLNISRNTLAIKISRYDLS